MKIRSMILPIIMVGLIFTTTACASGNADPLNGTEWVLMDYDGKSPVEGTTVTIAFKDGAVTGSSGCNSYGGKYEIHSEKIAIRDVASTLMACTDPAGAMEQEGLFLNALNNAQVFQLNDNQLQITTSDGKTLTFSPKRAF
jgi:heat shock protein HslJ